MDKNQGQLSKKNLKKLERRKRHNELRKIRRENRKLSRKAGDLVQPTRRIRSRRKKVCNVNPNSICVAIDLDYDNIMSSKQIINSTKQCLHMYSINRSSTLPINLNFTGIKSNGNIHAAFDKLAGWKSWNVKYHFDKTHTEVFNGDEQLVYLTSESNNVLTTLQQNCVYVIGGLVDDGILKGLCHERAQKAGLATARLPLSEHVPMKPHSVLSSRQVFEILLRVNEGKTWLEAILQTIPSCKGAKRKGEDRNKADSDSEVNQINWELINLNDAMSTDTE